jgi:hypothetical protein
MGKAIEQLLKSIYLDLGSPASFAGVQKVLEEARKVNRKISLADVTHFMSKQRTYTLFKPRIKKFRRLKTVPSGLNTDWQCDLCIMDSIKEYNDGYRYILVCIDVLSRMIYAAEAESKKSEHMIEAFEKIFSKAKVLPNKLYSDAGVEFQAKKMKDYWKEKDVIKYVMYSPDLHAGLVERANRTIKERLYRYFSEKNTLRWLGVIDKIVGNLNKTVHSTTGMRPNEITYKNANALREKLYKEDEMKKPLRIKYKLGDIVRITKDKGQFTKGYYPNFTDELFKIAQVKRTNPPSYRITDLRGEEIKGIFYTQELVRTSEETAHRAEVLKTRVRKGVKEHLVRWIGYPDTHNSWIKDSDLVNSDG